MKLTLLLAATAFFGVQELSAGVREMSLRSEGVKEKSSGVQEFRSFSPPLNNTSGVQTNASDELSSQELKGVKGSQRPLASDASNSSTRQLVNLST